MTPLESLHSLIGEMKPIIRKIATKCELDRFFTALPDGYGNSRCGVVIHYNSIESGEFKDLKHVILKAYPDTSQ